ncbi:unnamed protein product [Amoebophrya sp. A120]|nr:unnamed protein product [Amoebophrya sp. A120]|eukprot:GSA120T00012906001.1
MAPASEQKEAHMLGQYVRTRMGDLIQLVEKMPLASRQDIADFATQRLVADMERQKTERLAKKKKNGTKSPGGNGDQQGGGDTTAQTSGTATPAKVDEDGPPRTGPSVEPGQVVEKPIDIDQDNNLTVESSEWGRSLLVAYRKAAKELMVGKREKEGLTLGSRWQGIEAVVSPHKTVAHANKHLHPSFVLKNEVESSDSSELEEKEDQPVQTPPAATAGGGLFGLLGGRAPPPPPSPPPPNPASVNEANERVNSVGGPSTAKPPPMDVQKNGTRKPKKTTGAEENHPGTNTVTKLALIANFRLRKPLQVKGNLGSALSRWKITMLASQQLRSVSEYGWTWKKMLLLYPREDLNWLSDQFMMYFLLRTGVVSTIVTTNANGTAPAQPPPPTPQPTPQPKGMKGKGKQGSMSMQRMNSASAVDSQKDELENLLSAPNWTGFGWVPIEHLQKLIVQYLRIRYPTVREHISGLIHFIPALTGALCKTKNLRDAETEVHFEVAVVILEITRLLWMRGLDNGGWKKEEVDLIRPGFNKFAGKNAQGMRSQKVFELLEKLGMDLTQDEQRSLVELVKECDLDQDGCTDWGEFVLILRRLQDEDTGKKLRHRYELEETLPDLLVEEVREQMYTLYESVVGDTRTVNYNFTSLKRILEGAKISHSTWVELEQAQVVPATMVGSDAVWHLLHDLYHGRRISPTFRNALDIWCEKMERRRGTYPDLIQSNPFLNSRYTWWLEAATVTEQRIRGKYQNDQWINSRIQQQGGNAATSGGAANAAAPGGATSPSTGAAGGSAAPSAPAAAS